MITVNIATRHEYIHNEVVMIPVQAHSTKTPGLVITRKYLGRDIEGVHKFSDKWWQITHQPSGYNLMTVGNLNSARKAAEQFGKLMDWAQPLEVIQQQYHLHHAELCRIRDEARQ